ncbi:MAG: S8 family serine peptidase [Xanthomonadaceae bacterium]|jgi:serine protease|nr:S8 family serine peptidase [Xanthomonadaceae bacterium]
MKKKQISAALAVSVLMAAIGVPGVMAADAQTVINPAINQADSGSTDRIVVTYGSSLQGRGLSAKLDSVRTAAAQAGIQHMNAGATLRSAVVPLDAQFLRQTATKRDVIRLSRALNATEQTRLIAELKRNPEVESVVFSSRASIVDIPVKLNDATKAAVPTANPNDPRFATYQWHLRATNGGIDAPSAWDNGAGAGVVVAVLDTGILPGHPDGPVNLLDGYDFISDKDVSGRETDDRVPGGIDTGDWVVAGECGIGRPAEDSSWHGTHVAGTIAEATNNGVGGAGAAYNATVLPVRVLGHCGGYEDDIADAIIWASGGHVEGVPDNGNPADVINMSLGGSGACSSHELYQEAIDIATANGTVVVVAAGNGNTNAANTSPSSCNNVISVGANRIGGGRASYSNYGATVDISAPGGGGSADTGNDGWDGYVFQIGYLGTTTNTSGAYGYMGMAGTSMASPHVAGVVALVQSALVGAGKDPLTPAGMETLLKQTARPFPVTIPASTPIGAGIVDPKAAIDQALEEPCVGAGCGPEAIPLVNKAYVTVSGGLASETLYSFEATAGAILSIITVGGTGDVSMYVSYEKVPTAASHEFYSTRKGNNETVRVTAPKAGTYYINLVGEAAYSGVSLTARQ